MKQFLLNLIFWDSPAHGGFFGMTLLLTLPWLWLVACSRSFEFLRHLPLQSDVYSYYHPLTPVSLCTVPNVTAAVIGCYSLFLILRTVPTLWRNLHFTPLPLLLHAAWLLLLVVGAKMLLDIAVATLRQMLTESIQSSWLSHIHIHGNGWFWMTAAVVAALVGSYILFGRILSAAYGMPFRSLFCLSVKLTYTIVGLCYVVTLVLAFQANADYKRAITELAEFHGRPMDCKALGELYFHGEKPSAEFWTRFEELTQKIDERKGQCGIAEVPPDDLRSEMPDELYGACRKFFTEEAALKEFEALLEKPLPPNSRDYDNDKLLAAMTMSELSLCMQAARIETQSLRFAIEANDVQAAKKTLLRMDNLCRYQQHDSVLIGSLVWIAMETRRLDAINYFISSGLADEFWLQGQLAALEELEPVIAQVHRLTIYSEAVFGINAMVFSVDNPMPDTYRPIRLRPLWWFAPQMWRLTVHEATELFKAYAVTDFSDMEEFLHKPNLWGCMVGASFTAATRKFQQMVVKTRITKGIIAAGLHKIHNGHYPETMDNLEMDPFSGQPLKYMVGDCEIFVNVIKPHEKASEEDEPLELPEGLFDSDATSIAEAFPPSRYDVTKEPRTVQAVRIWSVGPNRKDDNGIYNHEINADDLQGFIVMEQ